jgi:hypothetical protein
MSHHETIKDERAGCSITPPSESLMKRKETEPANENMEQRETFKAKFPSPRTPNGNAITNVSAEWIGDEDFLYTGRSEEGFHANVVAIGEEHKLVVWNRAFPTAREASNAALGIKEKPKDETPGGSR